MKFLKTGMSTIVEESKNWRGAILNFCCPHNVGGRGRGDLVVSAGKKESSEERGQGGISALKEDFGSTLANCMNGRFYR